MSEETGSDSSISSSSTPCSAGAALLIRFSGSEIVIFQSVTPFCQLRVIPHPHLNRWVNLKEYCCTYSGQGCQPKEDAREVLLIVFLLATYRKSSSEAHMLLAPYNLRRKLPFASCTSWLKVSAISCFLYTRLNYFVCVLTMLSWMSQTPFFFKYSMYMFNFVAAWVTTITSSSVFVPTTTVGFRESVEDRVIRVSGYEQQFYPASPEWLADA